MNSFNEFEAIQVTRERSSEADRRQVWQLEAITSKTKRTSHGLDGIIAALGRFVEKAGTTTGAMDHA
jgi:hypothetical protein